MSSLHVFSLMSQQNISETQIIMPQWYYDKKDLKNTPSYNVGLDSDTEVRYRREGARYMNTY